MRKFLIDGLFIALLNFGVCAAPPAATEDKPAGTTSAAPKTKVELKKEAHAEYRAAKARADADYKTAKAECDKKQGGEKKACTKEAKDARKKAIADAEKKYGISAPTVPLEARVF
jgi:hypothetical protein